jgi:hypothetical protein
VTAREYVRHFEPSQRAGKYFIHRGIAGSVIMLNLLHLRAVVDYSANPELAPEAPISGAEAFNRLFVTHYRFCMKAAVTFCSLVLAEHS